MFVRNGKRLTNPRNPYDPYKRSLLPRPYCFESSLLPRPDCFESSILCKCDGFSLFNY